MTNTFFESQINRLRTQWPHSYGKERKDLFWNAFQNVQENIFSEAVSYMLGNSRSAPMVGDLDKAVNQAITNSYSTRTSGSYSLANTLLEAQGANKRADKQFVDACMKHIKLFMTGGITKQQFDQGCDDLDRLASVINPPPRDYPARHVQPTMYKSNSYKRYEDRFRERE